MSCQGPTISPVYSLSDGAGASNGAAAQHGFWAVTICVPKSRLYSSVKDLRAVRLPPAQPLISLVHTWQVLQQHPVCL